jgi:uncharacterized protein (TIGR00297 family)
MNELKSLTVLSLITISLIVLFEFLARKNIISKSFSRKLLHITSGFIVVYVPFVINSFLLVILIGSVFTISNYLMIKNRILKQIDDGKSENLGIFYYPLSFLITVLLFWNVNKYLISLSFLVFSICDAMAALVGSSAKSKYFTNITKEPKTFNGAFTFVLVSFLLMWFIKFTFWEKLNFIEYDELSFAFIALIFSLLGGITEAISTKGTDNLTLPIVLSTAGMIFFVVGINLAGFILAFILAILISLISFRLKFLDLGGSIVTFLLALFIFGIGGWKWTVPILSFFILSSLLSKIAETLSSKEINQIFEKGSRRDYKQVLANGGVPLLICVLSVLIPDTIDWYLVYLLAVAISTADTWSTEIGTLFSKNVYLITSLKKVNAGISGGISFIGTIGGIAGSFFITLSAFLFVNLQMIDVLIILIFAFLGNLFDSLLGATLQVVYKCPACLKLTEKKFHCQVKTTYYKGLKFIDNDFVNFSSVLFVSLLYFIFLII